MPKNFNLIKSLLMGLLLWVIIFFEVSILMFGFKLSAPNMVYYVIHYILLVIFLIFVSWLYFRKEKAGIKNGLLFGVILIIVGVILDSAITIPLFIKNYGFLIQPEMMISALMGIIIPSVVGALKK